MESTHFEKPLGFEDAVDSLRSEEPPTLFHERTAAEMEDTVRKGLALQDLIPEVSDDTRRRIEYVIATTAVDASQILRVPCSHTFQCVPENEMPKSTTKRNKFSRATMEEIYLGNAVVGANIQFRDSYLQSIAHKLEILPPNLRNYYDDELRLSVAHEIYHLRQAMLFPNVMREESKWRGKVPWRTMQSEFAAELFAVMFVQARGAHGWKEALIKAVSTLKGTYLLHRFQGGGRKLDLDDARKRYIARVGNEILGKILSSMNPVPPDQAS